MTETKMTTVSFRVPVDLYKQYKSVLRANSQIPTYEFRNHMEEVIEKNADKNKSSKNA